MYVFVRGEILEKKFIYISAMYCSIIFYYAIFCLCQ